MGSRMIITLSEEDKAWLESYSKTHQVSMAEAVRSGVRKLIESEREDTYKTIVGKTRGIWQKDNGLAYQEKIRSEWDER